MLQARAGSGEREKKNKGLNLSSFLEKSGHAASCSGVFLLVRLSSGVVSFILPEKGIPSMCDLCTNRILIIARCLGPMKKLQNRS
jgi:hypothetical protein